MIESEQSDCPLDMQSLANRRLHLSVLLVIPFIFGVVSCAACFYLIPMFNAKDDTASTSMETDEFEGTRDLPRVPSIATSNTEADQTKVEVPGASFGDLTSPERYNSRFQRDLALHTFLTKADEGRVLDLLEHSKRIPSSRGQNVQRIILRRLAEINPQKAYEQVGNLNEMYPGELVSLVFEEWSFSNRDEAISFAGSLDNRTTKYSALVGILRDRSDLSEDTRRQIARELGYEQYADGLIAQEKIDESIVNPEKTWYEVVGSLDEDEQDPWALSRIASVWVEKNGIAVLDRVAESLTNLEVRRQILSLVLRNVAETDPQGAFEFALGLEYDRNNNTISTVMYSWAQVDPQSALVAANGVEKSGLRRDLQQAVIFSWSNNDPHSLLERIEELPQSLRSRATSSALSAIVEESPTEATELLATIEDAQIKGDAASSIAQSWSRTDPKAALNWALTDPTVGDFTNQLLSLILYHVAEIDAQLALETALQQPIEEGSTGLEATVIQWVAGSNFDKALELLPRVREGQTQLNAYRSVSWHYLRNGETEKIISLAQQLPDSNRQDYFRRVLASWAGFDPEGLFDSIDRLPSDEIKSMAALNLIEENDRQEILDAEQIERVKKLLMNEDAEKFE